MIKYERLVVKYLFKNFYLIFQFLVNFIRELCNYANQDLALFFVGQMTDKQISKYIFDCV